ncbi:MAG: ABC transporter permease [Bryobacterales bacterium]|nr:ABC transporter permease [Bryobacterales bacterium]
MLQDLGYALRLIRTNPWFSAAIVLTLAFGIGVNTTVFTLVNAVLFKPLPFVGGERLVTLQNTNPERPGDQRSLFYADFREYRTHQQSFEYLEGFRFSGASISEKGNPPQSFPAGRVTAGMFRMLHIAPVLGRDFTPADEKAGAEPVVILGYGIWSDRYGKDPAVIGRVVRLNEKPTTIIGVMPEGFRFPNNQDMWIPLVADAELEKRQNAPIMGIGILKEDSSIAQATAELSIIANRLAREFPATNKDLGILVRTFHQTFNGGPIRLVFLLMLGAVAFVLLIACANVANMMLSRAVGRTREVSIRAALGASRWRIIRQLLVESVLLSMIGGLLGLGLSTFGVRAFSDAVSDVGKPYWITFTMDFTVFAYFAAISVVAGLMFGLAPAWHTSKVDLNHALKDGTRSSGSRRGGYLSSALVVFQFTLALVLLTGAGLMMRSFLAAQASNDGIRSHQILTGRINLGRERYGKPEQRQQFYDRLIPALRALPGVTMASAASAIPGAGFDGWRFEIEGQASVDPRQLPAAAGVIATPGYFQTLGAGVLQGREFDDTDGGAGKEVAIVGERMALRYFAGQNPIGKRIRYYIDNQPKPWMTIVGLVRDFRQSSPGDSREDPLIVIPLRQDPLSSMVLVLRTASQPQTLNTAMRAEVQKLDEDLPVVRPMSMAEQFERQRWHLRVFGSLFAAFAGIALVMAAVGIYGVVAHATMRRTQEIGVRMAMGAEMGDVIRLVMKRGLIQLGLGLVFGLSIAFAVTRLMRQIILVSPTDPLTFGVVTFVLTAAGVAACWLPARRAAVMDPVKALRYE